MHCSPLLSVFRFHLNLLHLYQRHLIFLGIGQKLPTSISLDIQAAEAHAFILGPCALRLQLRLDAEPVGLGSCGRWEDPCERQLGTAEPSAWQQPSSGASRAGAACDALGQWDRYTSLSCKFWNTPSSQRSAITSDFLVRAGWLRTSHLITFGKWCLQAGFGSKLWEEKLFLTLLLQDLSTYLHL